MLVFFMLILCKLASSSSVIDDPTSLVLSSVDDQMNSAIMGPDKPWSGFAPPLRIRKPPLYGLTYYPWRTKKNCSLTQSEIESDLKLISDLTGSIYIFELYCDFGPLLVNLTRHHNMSILIGLPLMDNYEFQRQSQVLRDIFSTPHLNLSHVVAISIGHMDLLDKLNKPNASGFAEFVSQRLSNVSNIIRRSAFPDIPVSTTDYMDSFFRFQLSKQMQVYMESYNPMDDQHDPNLAAKLLHIQVSNVRSVAGFLIEDTATTKPVILTDIGWASQGYFEQKIKGKKVSNQINNKTQVNYLDQLRFLYRLRCCQENYVSPSMYYVHSAFDLTWNYADKTDSNAYWGLADAENRQLKPYMHFVLFEHQCRDELNLKTEEERKAVKTRLWLIIGICTVLGLLFVIMFILVVWIWRRKQRAVKRLKVTQQQHLDFLRNCSTTSADSEANRYVQDVKKFSRWDDYLNMLEPEYEDLSELVEPVLRIDLSELELREIVGEGHFGIVQKAMYYRGDRAMEVAVKRLHVGARNVNQFLQEGIKMQKFTHSNVLSLIGISFTPTNMPMIITPYLTGGDVLDYVRKTENKNAPINRLTNFCAQIAEGMRYLHELKMIHRDLAARNCMLDKELTVKIADFGLCRDISDTDAYQTTKAFELPIRWMPPEAIDKLSWTSKSDVWSFGIVMWEIFSRGQQPYSDVPMIELRAYLKNGGRLGKPEACPDIIYEIIQACFATRPTCRPDFNDLCQSLPFLLQALERGKTLDDIKYYNVIMPILNKRRETTDSERQFSPPQSPAHKGIFAEISEREVVKSPFDRAMRIMWSMPRRSKVHAANKAVFRKNSVS